MPQFRYEVKRGPGEADSGFIDAENQRAAVARLRDMGYYPISVVEHTEEAGQTNLRQTFARVRLKDRNIFFRQLANLVESGMPLVRALSTLLEQTSNPKARAMIEGLREDVQHGTTFAEALERRPKVFSPIHYNLVRAGEEGGMLEEVLWRLVAFGEQEEELRGKTISAMVYPAFLLGMGSLAIFILVSFVFPKFVLIFEDFNQQLPWPTLVVMRFCEFMGAYWWAVLLGLAGLVSGIVSYARSPQGRMQFDLWALKVPVVGPVVLRYEMAKFARTLGTLLDNGVPVLTSLTITADTLGNRAVAGEIEQVKTRVSKGGGISDGLRECRFFPPVVINMIATGEESGRLGAITKRIADAYDVEVDRAVKTMTSLFEPILVVVMGVIIGFLVIAMMLPMLTLSANVA